MSPQTVLLPGVDQTRAADLAARLARLAPQRYRWTMLLLVTGKAEAQNIAALRHSYAGGRLIAKRRAASKRAKQARKVNR